MKLSVKIFFGICIPSIIAIFIISANVIEENHNTNIESERLSAVQNVKDIERNINNVNKESVKDILELMSDSYDKKGISITYYNNGIVEFNSSKDIQVSLDELSNIQEKQYTTNLQEGDGNSYIFVISKIDSDRYVVVIKNINNVYTTRQNLIRRCIYIVAIAIVGIAVIAYLLSKSITRPLEKMKKEMAKLSKGNYDIHLKESHSEFGKLSKNFNSMSRELERRNNELVESANNKQIFIDNLSHEMNTPLTSIQGYAELLEKANLNDELKIKYLKYIQDESKRIQDMYKKLLLLSYKKNSDFEKIDVDMNYVFTEVQNTLKERLSNSNIELIVNNQLGYLHGDETLIIMAVSNLVKNAINVSSKKSKIIINAFEMNKKKYIQVTDQGPGISKEEIKKITEPFYRVDKVRSRKNGGAGLGLSICKSIMEMHNGDLKIESELGKGSMFILEFPA